MNTQSYRIQWQNIGKMYQNVTEHSGNCMNKVTKYNDQVNAEYMTMLANTMTLMAYVWTMLLNTMTL